VSVKKYLTEISPNAMYRADLKKDLKRQEGFTLIELMAGLVIFGILAAIAVPSFLKVMPKYRLNGAARQVMSDLMSARMKAITLNRSVGIFFLDNHTYRMCDDANGDGVVGNPEGNAQTKDIQADYYNVTFASTGDSIFDPRGTAAPAVTVTLTNSSGPKSITVTTSGGVRIN
jgi:type IV fimbrial biogenesis protein FimT